MGHEESHSLWEGMEVKFYVIRLKAEERDELTRLVKTGREAAYRRRNAQICCWQTRENTDLDNATRR